MTKHPRPRRSRICANGSSSSSRKSKRKQANVSVESATSSRRQMQRLGLALRVQLLRHRADDPRIEPDLAENRANLLDAQRRLIKIQVHDVVIAIDFIAQARHCLKFVIELEDLLQIADSGGVDF